MNHPIKKQLIVAIFNYNHNDNAQRLKQIFLPHFPTYIFDSGSEPPCPDAIRFDNIYYGGMWNELQKKAKNYEWACLITSDVQIADSMVDAIPQRMKQIMNYPNVANYQPSCHEQGRSHQYGYNKSTGSFRAVPYLEGWFHMFRTSLGFSLDLSLNRIGWGTDLYLCKRARDKKMLNVVDDAVTVLHPKETGFSNHEAAQQMAAWADTIPDFYNQITTGVGIICYEGTEHLRDIITEIRHEVDHIALLWSDTSYAGVPANDKDRAEVNRLKDEGLVDSLVSFPHIPHLPPREQETVRRNQGLAYFQELGIDYALISDSDEFYYRDEFVKAKHLIVQWLPQASFCYYRNYYKFKNCELMDECFPAPRVVPFLCSTTQRFQYEIPFSNPSDPTRRMQTYYNMFIPKEVVTMRHWSWIRADIRSKILNWSSADMFPQKEIDEMVEYYETFVSRNDYMLGSTFVRIPHKIKHNKVEVRWEK